MANISQGQLRVMINQMVEQAVGEKMGARAASWQSDYRADRARLSYDNKPRNRDSSGFDWGGFASLLTNTAKIMENERNKAAKAGAWEEERTKARSGNYYNSSGKQITEKDVNEAYRKSQVKHTSDYLAGIGGTISGALGVAQAYKNADPIGGAFSGYSMGNSLGSMFSAHTFLGQWGGMLGLGIGLLGGLFGKKKEINEWNRPKFKDAEQAYTKLFTVDRGERDLYHMPESFYFRNGWSGARHIVVKVGNEQFNDHIRESITGSYSNQLQRGLVF